MKQPLLTRVIASLIISGFSLPLIAANNNLVTVTQDYLANPLEANPKTEQVKVTANL